MPSRSPVPCKSTAQWHLALTDLVSKWHTGARVSRPWDEKHGIETFIPVVGRHGRPDAVHLAACIFCGAAHSNSGAATLARIGVLAREIPAAILLGGRG
jgi:hypothetical protein